MQLMNIKEKRKANLTQDEACADSPNGVPDFRFNKVFASKICGTADIKSSI